MKHTRLQTILSVGLLFILGVTQAFAQQGVRIRGKAYNVGGTIASTAHLNSVKSELESDILKAAKQISSAIGNNVTASNTNARLSSQVSEAVAKNQQKGAEAAKIRDRYSNESMGYSACYDSVSSSAYRDTSVGATKTSKKTRDKLYNYNSAGAKIAAAGKKFRKRLTETTESTDLLYSDQTLSLEDWEKGEDLIKNMVNPVPDPSLPPEASKTEKAKRYNTMVAYKAQLLDLPIRVLTDIHAEEDPGEPGDTLRGIDANDPKVLDLWMKIDQNRGNPLPYANKDGRISKRLYQRLMIDKQISNPDWADSTKVMTSKGILIEIAKMQAIALDMQYQQLDLLKKIAMMNASREIKNIHESLDPGINQLYQQIMTSGTHDMANGSAQNANTDAQ